MNLSINKIIKKMFINISDFKNEMVDYFDNGKFMYGLNPVKIMVIPCELNELISRFDEITDDIKNVIIKDIYKMDDRVILNIKSKIVHCLVIKFINVASNIYELHIKLISKHANIEKLAEF